MNDNPILAAIMARGVEKIGAPVDMSGIFRDKGITSVYVIAMTGRCGSTWLASELSALPNCGKPNEYFSEEMIPFVKPGTEFEDVVDLLRSIVEAGRTGDTFGFKIDGRRLRHLSSIIDIRSSFGPEVAKWIDMRRLNIVKQAFSFARAKQTGVWHVYAGAEAPASAHPNEVEQDSLTDATIWRELGFLKESEVELSETYRHLGLTPLPIKYEEMVDSKMQVLIQSLAHLFPERVLPEIPDEERGRTRKLAGIKTDPVEISFVRRNANKLNQFRLDA